MSIEKVQQAIKIFEEYGGVMQTTEAWDAGIYSRTLYAMRNEGVITQLERGLYKLAGKQLSNPDLVVVAKKVNNARISLLSALDFHDMTTEIPHSVHIALPRTSRDPRINYPPVSVHRFSGQSLTEGVDVHTIDGVDIQIYNPAKTIADCFKFRHKIGLDIAIEALKQGVEEGKASYSDILKYADICRVKTVIKPYLEMSAHD